MVLKDYYAILGIPPSATTAEIKKAYRLLAMDCHPDKKPDDPYAAARFREIREAYDTLIHPRKKENYLQQRWYYQSTGNRATGVTATPVSLLKQSLELEKYVSRLDVHRLDQESLAGYIESILSPENLQILKQFNEPDIYLEIIRCLLKVTDILDREKADKSYTALLLLAEKMPSAQEEIRRHQLQHRRVRRQEYWQPWLMALLSVLLLLFLWWMS